jgi:hypothetical protein
VILGDLGRFLWQGAEEGKVSRASNGGKMLMEWRSLERWRLRKRSASTPVRRRLSGD